jgi:UDPglucose--hexose-1-phosphate uridylyltransferase
LGVALPELRKDPVTSRWVIIANDRARRPVDFARETVEIKGGRFCPFCPGNELKTPPEVLAYRNGGGPNQPGWSVRVVPSKFPALRVEGNLERYGEGMYDRMDGLGAHEVIIETPDHMSTLSDLSEKQIESLLWAFRDRTLDLKRDVRLKYILFIKNHGESAGSTLEHSHSQLIALPVVPSQVQAEIDGAKRYFDFKDRCVYCDMVRQDADSGTRVVVETEHFLAVCPYAPRFPFETWIVPRHHYSHFETADAPLLETLSWVLRTLMQDRQSARKAAIQCRAPHGPPSRTADGPLPLASGGDPKADEGGWIRVGQRFLFESDATGRSRQVSARRGSVVARERAFVCEPQWSARVFGSLDVVQINPCNEAFCRAGLCSSDSTEPRRLRGVSRQQVPWLITKQLLQSGIGRLGLQPAGRCAVRPIHRYAAIRASHTVGPLRAALFGNAPQWPVVVREDMNAAFAADKNCHRIGCRKTHATRSDCGFQ